MKKKTEPVTFKVSLPMLPVWANLRLNYVLRDLEEFKKYGFNEEKLEALSNRVNDLFNYPTDAEHIGTIMICTKEKERLTNEVRQVMTSLFTRARNKFGVHSPYYRWFGNAKVSAMHGKELLCAAMYMHHVATLLLEKLASEGLTPEFLQNFNTLITTYRDAIDAQDDAIAERILATQHRVKEANAIYGMVVNLCHTGKRIWESECVTRYKDYVIYEARSRKKKTAQRPRGKKTVEKK